MPARGKVYRKESVMKRHLRNFLIYIGIMAAVVGLRLLLGNTDTEYLGRSLMGASSVGFAIGLLRLPLTFSKFSRPRMSGTASFFMIGMFRSGSDYHNTFKNSNISKPEYPSKLEMALDLALPFIAALPVNLAALAILGEKAFM